MNDKRRRWFPRTSIRDMLWGVIVVSLGVAWWVGYRRTESIEQDLRLERFRARVALSELHKKTGGTLKIVEWTGKPGVDGRVEYPDGSHGSSYSSRLNSK